MTGLGPTVLTAWLAALGAGVSVLALSRALSRQRGRHLVRRSGAVRSGPPALAVPWEPPASLRRWFSRADLDSSAPRLWTAWSVAVAVIPLVTAATAGVGAAVVVAAVTAGGPLVWLWSWRDRAEARLVASLPGALEAVARSLRSGASLAGAVAEAGEADPSPAGQELRRVASRVARGSPLESALADLAERRPLRPVGLAVAALRLAASTGGARARAMDGVAATLRDRLVVDSEVRAQAAQARISAAVLGVAPVAFGAFAAATDPRVGRLLFGTPLGLALVVAGLVLDVAGWAWMQRIVRSRW